CDREVDVADGEELAVVDVEVLGIDALGHHGLLVSDLVESPDEPGDEVEGQDDDDQRQGGAPHAVGGEVGDRAGDPVAVRVKVVRGRTSGVVQVGELVV